MQVSVQSVNSSAIALPEAASGMADIGMLGLLWPTPVGKALALENSGLAHILAGLPTTTCCC